MRVGAYLRVSTGEQNLDSQRQAIESWAAMQRSLDPKHPGITEWHEDVMGGSYFKRPSLNLLLENPPDVLVVFRTDRLTRSLAHLMEYIRIFTERNVRLVSVSESIDLGTPAGRMLTQMLAVFAEHERATITARVTAGLEAARARGVKLGRPVHPFAGAIREAILAGESRHSVAAQYGVTFHATYQFVTAAELKEAGVVSPRKKYQTSSGKRRAERERPDIDE